MRRSLYTMLIVLFYAICLQHVTAHAITQSNDSIADVIPNDFNFSVSDQCSGHDYFYQFSATEKGEFIILSRYTDVSADFDLVYKVCYIDIFDCKGNFVAELSFYTEQECAVELIESYIHIYFYDRIITYDIILDSLSGKLVEPGLFVKDGTIGRLQNKVTKEGKWKYICKSGFHGYTELRRTDGQTTEILAYYSQDTWTMYGFLMFVIMIGAGILIIRKRKKRIT